MDKLEAKRRAEIMLAWANGKAIQFIRKDSTTWIDSNSFPGNLSFNFDNINYRIKPEPKTVPLTIEDLYEHFKKGTIFKSKISEWFMRIEAVSLKIKEISICCGEELSLDDFINAYTFEDGSPLVKTIEE